MDLAPSSVRSTAIRRRHDFRRTAVRNLERAGVPRSTAMKMVGHRTEGIYRRYAIVDEAMLKEVTAKRQILHETQQSPASDVVRLADAKRLRSSSGRVVRSKREKIGSAIRGKLSKSGGKIMVGRDGIEPPTPGFSVRLGALNRRLHSRSHVGIRTVMAPSSSAHNRWRRVIPSGTVQVWGK